MKKKREICWINLAAAWLYGLVVDLFRKQLLEAGWPLSRGLNFTVEKEKDSAGLLPNTYKVRIKPVGWPEGNCIVARLITIHPLLGCDLFEATLNLQGLGLLQINLEVCGTMSGGPASWCLTDKFSGAIFTPEHLDTLV